MPRKSATTFNLLPYGIRTDFYAKSVGLGVHEENYNNLRPTSDSTEYIGVLPFLSWQERLRNAQAQ